MRVRSTRDGARGIPEPQRATLSGGLHLLFHNRPLLVLAGCAALFHLANATMLPLMASMVTKQMPDQATILIAACIVVPQLVVAACSPWVGRQAQVLGRKKILLIGFTALPIRGVLLAFVSDPYLLVVVHVLDGVSAAVLGVLVPLITADVTRGTGRFNLAQGMIGTAVGIGASVSGVLTGSVGKSLRKHSGVPDACGGRRRWADVGLGSHAGNARLGHEANDRSAHGTLSRALAGCYSTWKQGARQPLVCSRLAAPSRRLLDDEGPSTVRGALHPTQNSECRRNSRISLAFGVSSRDRRRP